MRFVTFGVVLGSLVRGPSLALTLPQSFAALLRSGRASQAGRSGVLSSLERCWLAERQTYGE